MARRSAGHPDDAELGLRKIGRRQPPWRSVSPTGWPALRRAMTSRGRF